MLSRIFSVSIAAFILIMIDLYVYQAIKIVIIDLNPLWTKIIVWTYWGVTLLTVASLYYYNFGNPYIFGRVSRTFLSIMELTNVDTISTSVSLGR